MCFLRRKSVASIGLLIVDILVRVQYEEDTTRTMARSWQKLDEKLGAKLATRPSKTILTVLMILGIFSR